MSKIKMFLVPNEHFAQAASDHIVSMIFQLVNSVSFTLGTATGGTMEDIYRFITERARRDFYLRESLQRANYFGMDEYVGLRADNPQSYAFFMRKHLLDPIGISPENLRLPCAETVMCAPEANDGRSVYDQMIASLGGLDIQFAGIGENGHLAFNEPGSSEKSWTRRVQLTQSTIEANARFFSNPSEVPREAYTMGLQTVLNARRVILFASGKKKARAIQRMIEGLPGPDCPASFLLRHPDVTVFLDWDAAANLRNVFNP